jgi:hypothetical protein
MRWYSEGIIIAATPFAAYTIAFVYHAGYAKFFGIPTELIYLDLKMVLIAGFPLVLVASLLFGISFGFWGFWPEGKRHHPIYRRAQMVFPGFALLIVLIAIHGPEWHAWLGALLAVVAILVLSFLGPLLTQRGKKPFVQKMADHDAAQRHDSILEFYLQGGLRTSLLALVWLAIASQIAYDIGAFRAQNQVQFFVRSTSPETVVLAIYGDNLVAAPFDRVKKTVEKGIVVLRVTDTPNVAMRLEQVGPLHHALD